MAALLSSASKRIRVFFFLLWNHPRVRAFRKAIYNFKITILCGLVTFLVVRGTFGAGAFGTPFFDAEILHRELKSFQERRLLQSVQSQLFLRQVDTYDLDIPFSMGPNITDWDAQRTAILSSCSSSGSTTTSTTNTSYPCNSTANGKPRVMLVSGSQPARCEYPIGDHLQLKFLKNKGDYARNKDMRIYYNMVQMDPVMGGAWGKLPLLRRLMLANPTTEWFWWMDTDTVITDMKFDLPWKRYAKYAMVVPGWKDMVYKEKDWVGLNTGSFLLRNTQWSLDLLSVWAAMGPKGRWREEAGKVLTAELKGRPESEADDQSALVYLMVKDKKRWGAAIQLESKFYLNGYWVDLVDKFEKLDESGQPGFGDDRWPFVTNFVGCKLCNGVGEYDAKTCASNMQRAYTLADNQVLRQYGYKHLNLNSSLLESINVTTRAWLSETHMLRKNLQKAEKKKREEEERLAIEKKALEDAEKRKVAASAGLGGMADANELVAKAWAKHGEEKVVVEEDDEEDVGRIRVERAEASAMAVLEGQMMKKMEENENGKKGQEVVVEEEEEEGEEPKAGADEPKAVDAAGEVEATAGVGVQKEVEVNGAESSGVENGEEGEEGAVKSFELVTGAEDTPAGGSEEDGGEDERENAGAAAVGSGDILGRSSNTEAVEEEGEVVGDEEKGEIDSRQKKNEIVSAEVQEAEVGGTADVVLGSEATGEKEETGGGVMVGEEEAEEHVAKKKEKQGDKEDKRKKKKDQSASKEADAEEEEVVVEEDEE